MLFRSLQSVVGSFIVTVLLRNQRRLSRTAWAVYRWQQGEGPLLVLALVRNTKTTFNSVGRCFRCICCYRDFNIAGHCLGFLPLRKAIVPQLACKSNGIGGNRENLAVSPNLFQNGFNENVQPKQSQFIFSCKQ